MFIFRAICENTAHVPYSLTHSLTLFIERMLYFPTSHSSEHRLHILFERPTYTLSYIF